ncbi:glycoside hydrolase family 32 protein [Saccharothrix isguenensis]
MSDHIDRYRPGFHFTPDRHWMNDPNGLVHHDGVYHLFFQHNPEGDGWGNMSWGHATSPDLVHWTEHPVAIPCGDDEEIFSGSVVVDHRNSSGFGVGDEPVLVAVYTSAYSDGKQAQSLAHSGDGGATWTKYAGNPVLDRGSKAFRDPKVSWQPGVGWLMVAVEAEAREVVFHRSDDLRNWDHLSTFGPVDGVESLWECPDLFALPVDGDPARSAWVLVVSLNPDHEGNGSATRYFVGDFDGVAFTASPDGFRRLDWGRDLYAAVTFENAPDARRVLLGWMSNWDYAASVPTSPWRGSMSLPRELSLSTVGGVVTLVQRPVAELGALEQPGFSMLPFTLTTPRSFDAAPPYRLDVACDSISADAVVIDLLCGRGHTTRLTYTPATEQLTLDRTASGDVDFHPAFPSADTATVPLRDGALRLQVYVDRGSVEVFAQDGSTTLTSQVFTPPAAATVVITGAGGPVRVSTLEYRPLRDARGRS